LAFRLEQEEKVAAAIKAIQKLEAEGELKNRLKLETALSIHDNFKTMSRMQFAALTPEQQKRAVKLVEKVDDLEDSLEDLKKKDFEVAGHLLYTCGVIAYYDNDVIQAQNYLNRAADCQAPNHQAQLETNESYRKRFILIHYFRALIQKNWGELSDALHEIEHSVRLLGENNTTEFLTPTTRAEIMSYNPGEELLCRAELNKVLERIKQLQISRTNDGMDLDSNQKRLRNRLLVLLGNNYFVAKDYEMALEQYCQALDFNPQDYYALASAGQCRQFLGDSASAQEVFGRCLTSIERSGDFNRKRERITRAVIAVLAAIAAKGSGNQSSYDHWVSEARELLEGDLKVDGLSPKFFSPFTKRLMSSTELLGAIEG
jgi:tetratricopeptide (TPR) repeat protein